jgi:hypothetical protein
MERGYAKTPCYDHINACLNEKLEDARGNNIYGISGSYSEASRASYGQEGAVDDGGL